MFLFLSKLLPLFLYPLGLACLLMVVALFALWKHPWVAAASISAALVMLLLTGNQWTSSWLLRSLEWQNTRTELPKAGAIVVLGGGTQPAFAPRPWINLGEEGDRVLYGAKLYREGKAPLLILSGGRIRWQEEEGPPESADMATIAQTMGVPASAILQDPISLNTRENAVNVKKILNSQEIGPRVLLVTSALHMPRSLLIFKRQGIEAIAAPTDFQVTEQDLKDIQSSPQAILLNLLPDADKLQQSTRALKEYIGLAVYRLRGWL